MTRGVGADADEAPPRTPGRVRWRVVGRIVAVQVVVLGLLCYDRVTDRD